MGRNLEIVPYRPWMKRDVLRITYKTGVYGEDPAGLGYQVDPYVFTHRYGLYYLKYEPELAFVALLDGHVMGYIIGTRETSRYRKHMQETILPSCMRRVSRLRFGISSNGDGQFGLGDEERSIERALVASMMTEDDDSVQNQIELLYPAHLHINVDPDVQRGGLGSSLMKTFLSRISEDGVRGLHLITTQRNTRAIPFYKKLGFDMVYSRTAHSIWPDGEPVQVVTFTKDLPSV